MFRHTVGLLPLAFFPRTHASRRLCHSSLLLLLPYSFSINTTPRLLPCNIFDIVTPPVSVASIVLPSSFCSKTTTKVLPYSCFTLTTQLRGAAREARPAPLVSGAKRPLSGLRFSPLVYHRRPPPLSCLWPGPRRVLLYLLSACLGVLLFFVPLVQATINPPPRHSRTIRPLFFASHSPPLLVVDDA